MRSVSLPFRISHQFATLCLIPLLCTVLLLSACKREKTTHSGSGIITNEKFIQTLYTNIDVKNPKEVFNHVYAQLNDEITIFPSENVYYIKFSLLGKIYNGTITMYIEDRAKGVLGFSYVTREEHKSRQKYFPMLGEFYDFSQKDGLEMTKIDDFTYSVTYLGKTVIFHLFNDGIAPPIKAKLRPDEVFVGPTFDESGLRFFLIFNKTISKLYWVLNEDGFVPETFYRVSDNLVIGDRTEFAFYNDTANTRKIMVGAEGDNVLQNNWYDGPFDQLPDNFVQTGQLHVQEYLEKHYPYYKGAIDKYGNFLRKKGSRIAVAPYIVYFSRSDLNFVDSLAALGMETPEFYKEITRQAFDVPPLYYADAIIDTTKRVTKR